jgi:hypothetical protein
MTAHTRFITDNVAVCEEPDRLDNFEFVVADAAEFPEPMCVECYHLVATHNKRQYEKEMYSDMKIVQKLPRYEVDPNPNELFFTGLALASAFWVTVFVILWAVWLR